MQKLEATLTAIVGIVLIIALVCIILALPVQLLWNWLIPEIFGLKTITFYQALGLTFLSHLLFSSTNQNQNKKQ